MVCLGQYCTILATLIKLKRWRFLWLLAFVLSAASNHVLYNVVGSWAAKFGLQSFMTVNGDDFAENSFIIGEVKKHQNEFAVLSSLIEEQRKRSKGKYEIEDCSTSADDQHGCHRKLLNLMVSQSSNKFFHYVEFNPANKNLSHMTCNLAYGSELYCPFIATLVNTANYGVANAKYRYKNITTFRYVPLVMSKKLLKSGSKSMCATDPEYVSVMPRTIIVQTFLLFASLFLYLLASTVPCIFSLKGRGFLQLLFRRGLSVVAYWFALWTLTIIEMTFAGVILAASHYIQCMGFYEIKRLFKLILTFNLHTCSIASLVFLLTVLIQKQFVTFVATLVIGFCCCVVLALSLLIFHWLKNAVNPGNALLLLPHGLLGDHLQAILVSQLRMEAENILHERALILSGVIWAVTVLLTLYLDFVTSCGNALFLHKPNWLCDIMCGVRQPKFDDDNLEPHVATMEEVKGLNPVVKIRNLGMVYESSIGQEKVVALTNVSVTVYENQLTAFVGHNGSGKSTLFNILTGKTIATSGSAFLGEYDISDVKARCMLARFMGVCNQQNALCSGISVSSTINLLKSACKNEEGDFETEAEYILLQLGLQDKLSQLVCNLSSGQKRKLCIAMALLGNPKLVCLDEPTSNLDPVSRRVLWKLLQEYRLGRCIIISTSLMEEADILADRKIFLSEGTPICAGSSLFLRRAFDCGFIFKTKVKTERHVGWVLRAVNKRYPSVRARSVFRSDIELEVAANADQQLPGVAEALEKLSDLVESYELAQHSLEQIFGIMKAMKRTEIEQLFITGEIGYTVDNVPTSEQPRPLGAFSSTWSRSFTSHSPSLMQRIKAMLILSFMRIIRKWSTIFSRIIFPVLLLLLLIACLVVERNLKVSDLKLWSVVSGSRGLNFTRGLCIDDGYTKREGYKYPHPPPPDYHIPGPRLCIETMTNHGNNSRFENRFVFTSKTHQISILDHFKNKVDKSDDFQKHCARPSKLYEPCPVLHLSDYCEDAHSADKTISLGFYSLHEHFTVDLASDYLLWVYKRTTDRLNLKLNPTVKMNLNVTGVKDFRTLFIPFLGIFFQMMILCIVPATYLDDLMELKLSGVRDQLKTLGMGSAHYWACMLIVHWLQYALLYILSTLLVHIVLSGSYLYACFILSVNLPTLFLGLVSNLLCAYFVSSIFARPSTVAFAVYSIASTILGASLLLAQLDNWAALILICLFPQVASVALTFYSAKLILYTINFMKAKSLTEVTGAPDFLYTSLHIVMATFAVLAHIILLCLAIFIMEKRCAIRRVCFGRKKDASSHIYIPCEDHRVQQETEMLEKNPRDESNLLEVRHMRIEGGEGPSRVRDISFAVRKGEIFGLLGPNGSGKTTVASAVAGRFVASKGECEINTGSNKWLASEAAASAGKIGYCLSSNPLLSDVTVEEHLSFYANILGVLEEKVETLVKELIKIFHLESDKDKQIIHVSNGCKRRLSMAIALLADPVLVVIDDPSEGVDTVGRQLIVSAIKSIANENRAVLVTMHSMAEVEALCTRMAILNRGLVVEIGTSDQVISRFGQIYTLSIQLEEDASVRVELRQSRIQRLVKAVLKKFPDAFIVEQMAASILVCMPSSNIESMSHVLKWLLENKKSLGISIFSLRKVYLTEVFELIIKNHDDKLLRERHSIFSIVETPLSDQIDSPTTQDV